MSSNLSERPSKLTEMRKQREIARMNEELDKYQANIRKRNKLNILLVVIFVVLLVGLGFIGMQWLKTSKAQTKLEGLVSYQTESAIQTEQVEETEISTKLS